MRRQFANELLIKMRENDKIFLLTGDLGYKMWDEIKKEFPERFINCGAAEQAMLDIAVGMAYDGKIPFCYTITPFFLRAFETIRTYLDHEKLNVKLIGAGRDKQYEHDGYSHNAEDIKKIFDTLPNLVQCYPNEDEVKDTLELAIINERPTFISLSR